MKQNTVNAMHSKIKRKEKRKRREKPLDALSIMPGLSHVRRLFTTRTSGDIQTVVWYTANSGR